MTFDTISFCTKCLRMENIKRNIYGEALCEDCWDDYINSDRGKIEYFIDIVNDKVDMNYFDADFLGEVVQSWLTNKHLIGLTEKELVEAEVIAFFLGLLDKQEV